MCSFKHFKVRPLMYLYHSPWPPSPAVAPRLDSSSTATIEEEKTPYYDTRHFYPARLGEILHDGRYQIATKLGHGSSSTVWLARDLHRWRWSNEKYVAIKISSNSQQSHQTAVRNELSILQHISQQSTTHVGHHFVRRLLDSFTIDGKGGIRHQCLVLPPLREPLWLYCRRWVGGVIPPEVLKVMIQMMLEGLDYLHTECQIIHTDLKSDNIMIKVEDPIILERDARDEYNNPLPQKVTDERTIYLARNNYGELVKPTAAVQITDFDLAVSGMTKHTGPIQVESYRAPEVILNAGYTYSADIWNLGVMLWDLLEGKRLFNPKNLHTSEYDDMLHLAQITALLGPAPEHMLAAGQRSSMFYKPDGTLHDPGLVPKDFSFESAIKELTGEEKSGFIEFAKRMIKWNPSERSTAKELLEDPWLSQDLPQEAE
ncbi:hypothetical protein ED733_000831 [Metarhizium rileyi]|uniref:non-specific serine/threonine protein kinase n=1 Tax=Metarhizium rileyi (strain RCEF 4871) TaxID=1649241 RepID=A0A5C6FY65_METRR|nr:hypothetical protein ED733_000831 [Metarhizium rileyi]